jgi:hypothetical protein
MTGIGSKKCTRAALPVMLTPQAVETGRIVFQASPGKKCKRPHLNPEKLGVVVHACRPSNAGSVKRGIGSRPAQAQNAMPYFKNT